MVRLDDNVYVVYHHLGCQSVSSRSWTKIDENLAARKKSTSVFMCVFITTFVCVSQAVYISLTQCSWEKNDLKFLFFEIELFSGVRIRVVLGSIVFILSTLSRLNGANFMRKTHRVMVYNAAEHTRVCLCGTSFLDSSVDSEQTG